MALLAEAEVILKGVSDPCGAERREQVRANRRSQGAVTFQELLFQFIYEA